MGFSENKMRFAAEVWQGTVGQIRRAPVLSAKWKAMALAGDPQLATLATYVTDGMSSFISNIDRLAAASNDAVKGPLVDAAVTFITAGQFTTAQAKAKMAQLRTACVALRNADKSTVQLLTAALDTFAASVPAIPDDAGIDSVWI